MRTGTYCLRFLRQTQFGSTISGNSDGQVDAICLSFPFTDDLSLDGVIATFRPIHPFGEVGREQDVVETGISRVVVDTCQLIHHPSGDVAHEDMVERGIVELRTECPGLG